MTLGVLKCIIVSQVLRDICQTTQSQRSGISSSAFRDLSVMLAVSEKVGAETLVSRPKAVTKDMISVETSLLCQELS